MTSFGLVLLCLQCLLLKDVFTFSVSGAFPNKQLGLGPINMNPGLPLLGGNTAPLGNLGSTIANNLGTNIASPSALLSGNIASSVSPTYNPNWQLNAQSSPLVTEIVPSLQFGDINLEGDLPVTGAIKISGTFPVYGYIGVDGNVPSYGTAYIDTGNGLIDLCNCGLSI